MTDLKHQFNDPSAKVLVQLAQLNPWAEDYIKTASLDPEHGLKLADAAFAWEDRRVFPIDTPANALASYLYIEKQAESIPAYVKEAAKKMLDLYGVPLEDVIVEEQVKTAAPVYIFPEQQRWEITSSDDVALADAQLRRLDNEISFIEKTAAAVRLVRAAQHTGTAPSMQLMKTAGMVAGDINQTIDWLEVRAGVTDGAISARFTKLATQLTDVDPLCYSRDTLIKLATLISDMDASAGISHLYDRQIPTPTDTVFNTEKKAEDTVTVAGKTVPVTNLVTLPPDVWEQLLGEDAEQLKTDGEIDPQKVKDVVPTLPKDILVVLSRYV